jgi:hypothetical protein
LVDHECRYFLPILDTVQNTDGILESHLTALSGLMNGSSYGFSGGGGVIFALGGSHPCLRQVA